MLILIKGMNYFRVSRGENLADDLNCIILDLESLISRTKITDN
jgi:hypothetical protein